VRKLRILRAQKKKRRRETTGGSSRAGRTCSEGRIRGITLSYESIIIRVFGGTHGSGRIGLEDFCQNGYEEGGKIIRRVGTPMARRTHRHAQARDCSQRDCPDRISSTKKVQSTCGLEKLAIKKSRKTTSSNDKKSAGREKERGGKWVAMEKSGERRSAKKS